MARAYIGLGANLGDPPQQLRRAIDAIGALPGVSLVAASRLYRSDPMGPPGQPDYCNAVVAVETALDPDALLLRLVEIEDALGKRRGGPRWGARCIDLDLLLYDQQVVNRSRLTLPHAGIAQRNFVLVPLLEIAPAIEIPGGGAAETMLRKIGLAGIRPWDVG